MAAARFAAGMDALRNHLMTLNFPSVRQSSRLVYYGECRRCGSLVCVDRLDAHNMLWCPALPPAGDEDSSDENGQNLMEE